MPGYAGIDDLIEKLTVSEQVTTINWFKKFYWATSNATVSWYSTWYDAGVPGAGANPSVGGTTYNNDSTGGIVLPDLPAQSKYLLYAGASSGPQNVSIGVFDRLVAVGNIATSVGVKNVPTPVLPRYAGDASVGVQAWLEVTTNGGQAVVRLASYTNQAGVAGRSGAGLTFPSSSTPQRALIGPLPLETGDTGIRSVQQLEVTTNGSGAIVNLVLLRWIGAPFGVFWPSWCDLDMTLQGPRFPRIYDGATLCVAVRGQGISTQIHGQLQIGWV